MAGGGAFPPFVAVEPLVLPVVAEVGLLLSAAWWEPLPLLAPLELAFAKPVGLGADEGAEEGAEGPPGPVGACGGGGGDCVPEFGATTPAARISANDCDCVSVPCTVADACDLWEDWDARVALTSDAILDTAESL